jgi:hypothetical protein
LRVATEAVTVSLMRVSPLAAAAFGFMFVILCVREK